MFVRSHPNRMNIVFAKDKNFEKRCLFLADKLRSLHRLEPCNFRAMNPQVLFTLV